MAQRFVRATQERELTELALRFRVSEKRILGWEPTERHEHFDADGNPTGVTIVTREPEWDDHQRRRMQALIAYQAGVHDECGVHQSLAESPDFYWTWEARRCPVCATTAAHLRAQAEDDEAAMAALGEDPSALAERPDDGRYNVLRELSPIEAAAEKRRG